MPRPLLNHIHLPGLTAYPTALALQTALTSKFLEYKALLSAAAAAGGGTHLPPNSQEIPTAKPTPTILTFTPHPVYTFGRREPNPPSAEQVTELLRPLDLERYGVLKPSLSNDLRGGQTTFHGPGQLVAWVVCALDRPYSFAAGERAAAVAAGSVRSISSGDLLRREDQMCETSISNDAKFRPNATRLTTRSYVCLLEATTIATLRTYGIESRRTEDPGVWTMDGERKIAALGVHLRRNVTSFGVGLNLATDGRWWERIVACGLVGKGVSSIEREGGVFGDEEAVAEVSREVEEARLQDAAQRWVGLFAEKVGADVKRVDAESGDVKLLMKKIEGLHTTGSRENV